MTSSFDVLHESALHTDEFGEGSFNFSACLALLSLKDDRRAD